MEIAGDRPPRYGKKTARVTVGRGPVPRQRSHERKTSLVLFRSVGPEEASIAKSLLVAREILL